MVEDLDVSKAHVQAPTAIVFLCGGRYTDASIQEPASLRDAFLKILDFPPLRGRDLVQAEDFTILSLFGDYYSDILAFETDLAEITDLVLLFAESEGSLAELGSFVMVDEIASRLLVVVRDRHWGDDSFIKLGPLRSLEKRYGAAAVYIVDDDDLGIVNGSYASVKKHILGERLTGPVSDRLNREKEPTTFDPGRPGHVIKLAVGLIQEYGALTLDELSTLLASYGVTALNSRLSSLLLCARSVDWITQERKGSTTFYVASGTKKRAATIYLHADAEQKNRNRRRLLIRQHWEKHDTLRHMAIAKALGAAAL